MAQSGYTPILIYASGTTGNTPSAANMTSSASGAELALNYFDGKLLYKDSSGNVQVLASKAGNINVSSLSFGTTGLTPNTATTGAITVAGTLVVGNGGTGVTTSTGSGSVVLSAAPSLTGAVTIGTTSDTGTITVGQSTVSQTINISNGATASGSTKTVNIGTGGLTGSTTTMAIGSTFSTTVAANGTWSFSTPLVATNMVQATTSTSGYLTSTDWNTFNGKQAAGSYVTVGGALGTPSSGTLTNCTFPTLNQNTTGNAATATNAANASGNYFFTAGIGVGVENDIGVACNGQNSAYLYNNASAWGLYSGSGGSIISWQRASSLINMGGAVAVSGAVTATSYTGAGTGLTGTASSLSIGGNAATATTATTASGLSGSVSSLGTNGYYKIVSSGLMIQWGTTASLPTGTNNVVTFPIAFPTACLSVVNTDITITGTAQFVNPVTAVSTTNFTLRINVGGTGSKSVYWVAVGN